MKKIISFLLLLSFTVAVFAAPANKSAVRFKQPDGTTLYIVLHGDEAFHYYSTLDGVPVIKDGDGYCYAVLSNENLLVSSGCVAHNEGARNIEEQAIIAANRFSGMEEDMQEIAYQRAAQYTYSRATTNKFVGEMNVPVLLVEYADVKFSYTKEQISEILNKKDYEGYSYPSYIDDSGNVVCEKSPGSAKDYFVAQSGGLFTPNFIVTDIVTLPNNMSYYGANNANGTDLRRGQMIADGLARADANFDFSIFDNDGDGEAEFLYCIYAGYSESVSGNDENAVWPHAWTLSASVGKKTYDNVGFNSYACSQELTMNPEYSEYYGKEYLAGIGLVCHEFSHILGLFDLYNTKTGESLTFNYWDLMDLGNYAADAYAPVGYSAYQRELVGWKSLEVIDKKECYSLTALTRGGTGYKIVNDANSDEYFVLENRQQEGWDCYLFNAGMIITHIDYNKAAWDAHRVNEDKNHNRYALIPADDEITIYDGTNGGAASAGFRGDAWPGTSNNRAFTDTSKPAAKVYTGDYLGKPITNITMKDGVVSFRFLYDALAAPEALPAAEVAETSFRAGWAAVECATSYVVEVEKVMGESDAVLVERVETAELSYVFENLEADAVYRYKVAASDACGSSEFSQYATVALVPTSVDGVAAGDNGVCSIYTAAGAFVGTGDKNAVQQLAKGVYIVVDGNGKSEKIVVE